MSGKPSVTPSFPPPSSLVSSVRLWLCTFTLSVSVGAVLLLPLSILSNEVLLSFPDSYYMQWLNGSLIHGTAPPCNARAYAPSVVYMYALPFIQYWVTNAF